MQSKKPPNPTKHENEHSFSDFFELSEDVLKQTIQINSAPIKRTYQIIKAIITWAGFLNAKKIIGEPKFRLFIETGVDIEASRSLALRGYYRQAIMMLRSWLEILLLNIYFIDHQVELEWWLDDRWDDRPSFRELVEYIYKLSQFRDDSFPEKYRVELNALYRKLSKAIHGIGIPMGQGMAPVYDQGSFNKWYDYLSDTFRLTNLLLFRRFWDDLRQSGWYLDDIKAILGDHLIQELQELNIVLS